MDFIKICGTSFNASWMDENEEVKTNIPRTGYLIQAPSDNSITMQLIAAHNQIPTPEMGCGQILYHNFCCEVFNLISSYNKKVWDYVNEKVN